jgi:hypothetical protein
MPSFPYTEERLLSDLVGLVSIACREAKHREEPRMLRSEEEVEVLLDVVGEFDPVLRRRQRLCGVHRWFNPRVPEIVYG